MHTLKLACVVGMGACFERSYAFEGWAGVGFIALLLISHEAWKRLRTL